MSNERKQAEEKIKQKIVSAHRRGKCDAEGNSVLDSYGQMVAPPRKMPKVARTYVYRDGKMVEK
jgi:hypothetical protein